LTVVTILLVGAIGLYLLLATTIFRQDKSELVFDLNKSVVTTIATEVESSLRAAADKLRLYAMIFAGQADSRLQGAFQDIIGGDPLLVRLELYEQSSSGKMKRLSEISDREFEKVYGIDESFYGEILPQARPVPYDIIQTQSLSVWNATIANGPALMGMGISVIREGAKGVPEKLMAVIGYIKADLFLKNLRSSMINQAFIVGPDGRVLVHPRSEIMTQGRDFSNSPIVDQLKRGKIQSGVMQYKDGERELLGAYSKVNVGGLGVVSQVDSKKAFYAVRSLVTRSMLFAMIIVTITFIATVFFSRSLTRPLQRLMVAMERVAAGHLDTELKFNTRDEIQVLSESFNQMTQDLKTSRNQLEEINRELENKVIDRTKKLEEQNRAVKEAQEALIRTTRLASVGEIAGRAAHEVLNPLTSLMTRIQKVQKRLGEEIITHKDLLGEIAGAWKNDLQEKGIDGFFNSLKEPSQVNPEMSLLQEDLTNISEIFNNWDKDLATLSKDTQFLLQQAMRIEKILNQMRSLSTISGQRTRMNAHPILHDAVNIAADLFAKSQVQILEDYKAEIDDIRVDRDELIQVLTNLLRNSLHAVVESKPEKNKGYVKLETKSEGGKFMLDIIDNGAGIHPEHQPKLFEKQFSTKTPDLGTGLGLSISRRFVRAFNGDLFLVSSEPGGETRFRIELPLDVNKKEVAA
jgi:signal transduction histidine kinase